MMMMISSRFWFLHYYCWLTVLSSSSVVGGLQQQQQQQQQQYGGEVPAYSPSPVSHEVHETESPYVIILDGGSTGSRLHIFEFVVNEKGQEECVRRGTARADKPLSAFVGATPAEVADYLLSTFRYAAQQIPQQFQPHTRVLYQATAGMRLLTPEQQTDVYDAMYQGLKQHDDFVFGLHRDDIATLSGDLEGYYGALAANYLHGTINAELELVPDSGVVGALDMGGSSTQIVFLPQHHHHNQKQNQALSEDKDDEELETVCRNENPAVDDDYDTDTQSKEDCHVAQRDEYPRALQGEDFFAVSYLSYGADQFRERLWSTWIAEWQALHGTDETGKTCEAHLIPNPCAFKGYEAEWQGYTLVGTGQADKCVEEVQRHIPHPEETLEELGGNVVGGIEHPPVHGKFVAMSLYFFTLDTLRALSHPDPEAYEALNLSWPNPSIEELYNALDGLCSRQWQGDLEEIKHDAHPFTKAETLPHRCMEAVYIVTLLRDGFGFAPESRDITFTFLVDGSEVEWTLGMALAMRAEERFDQNHGMTMLEETSPGDKEDKLQNRASPTNNTHNRLSSSSTGASFVEDFRQQILANSAS